MMPNAGPQLNHPGATFPELEAAPASHVTGAIDAIDAISRCRVAVLDRANALVEREGTPSPDDTAPTPVWHADNTTSWVPHQS